MADNCLVMKFGGASVATLDSFDAVAHLIQVRLAHYKRIVAVVSATQGATDQYIALAHSVHPNPPRREFDMLITVGERISCSLLAMALDKRGTSAMSFTGSQAGIITSDQHCDAKILEVKPHRLMPAFHRGTVVVVAGFQGVGRQGSITTLGRGGTDTTAVALAVALKAECVEFYKDVGGIYEEDPKKNPTAHHHSQLTHREAWHIAQRSGRILHPRSLLLAERNALPLVVRSFTGQSSHTTITTPGQIPPTPPLYEACE